MRYLLTLLLGAIVGALLVFYFLVGAPGAKHLPGAAVKAPEAGGDPPGTVLVTLDEKFFDTLLGSIFRDLNAPSFRLAQNNDMQNDAGRTGAVDNGFSFQPIAFQQQAGGCTNTITVAPEGSNVKTGVRFTGGKVMAPLAFSGSYNVPLLGCTDFKGWAQADIQLAFDQSKQTVFGQINVEGVNLDNVSPILSGPITLFVQNAINERVNPLEVLRGQQLAISVPVQASNGTLNARVKDVRSEILDGSLRMHISYDFNGTK
jgi:hypothetical protein